MVKMMGFVDRSHCKINIHVNGSKGVQGFKSQLQNLSQYSLKYLTVENTEYKYDLDTVLDLCDNLPIVFDIHHEFFANGEYIPVTDSRIKDVIASWNGVRPVLHYSNSRGDKNKNELRSHSDYLWNRNANKIVCKYLSEFDVMLEAKMKNFASIKFYNDVKNLI